MSQPSRPPSQPARDAARPAGVPPDDELLDVRAAAALLGIKPQTLYAYASRGVLNSVPAARGRTRRYARADLLRLQRRAKARAGHTAVAAAALDWGEPVLDSSLTRITPEGPHYRGLSALKLARALVPFEAVAELLWAGVAAPLKPGAPGAPGASGTAGTSGTSGTSGSSGAAVTAAIAGLRELAIEWPQPALGLPLARLRALLPDDVAPLQLLLCAVPLWAQRDPARFLGAGLGEEAERARARGLLRRMTLVLALLRPGGEARLQKASRSERIAPALAVVLGSGSREQAAAIEHALILMADHELNASAFAARIAASAGTDLFGCVEAALAVLTGPQHGGACDRIEALLHEIGTPERAAATLHDRARRGDPLAFSHPLYPAGDPRTQPLLQLAFQLGGQRPRVRVLRAMLKALAEDGLPPPPVDAGLVAVAEALGLAPGSAGALFAVGRTAGWVAHVFEQRKSAAILRPRARYIGP